MTTPTAGQHDSLAAAAGAACAGLLPSSQPLTAGRPQTGTREAAAAFAGAAVADLGGAVAGRVAVLVGPELVAALAGSPLGGLDLGAAVQPAVDAAAASLGVTAQGARSVDVALVVDDLLATGATGFRLVPLEAGGPAAALLVPDEVLTALAAGEEPAQDVAVVGLATPPAVATQGSAVSPSATVRSIADGRRGLELLHGVEMEVTVELGRTRMAVRELLALSPGAVLALDRAAGSPADLLVNGRLIARGEVVVVDEDFGLRVTEILDQSAVG